MPRLNQRHGVRQSESIKILRGPSSIPKDGRSLSWITQSCFHSSIIPISINADVLVLEFYQLAN